MSDFVLLHQQNHVMCFDWPRYTQDGKDSFTLEEVKAIYPALFAADLDWRIYAAGGMYEIDYQNIFPAYGT